MEHLLSCIGHVGDHNESSPPSTGCRVHSLHSNYVLHDTADLLAVVATSLFKNGHFERIRSIICHFHLAQECQTSRQGSRRATLIQRRIRVISLRTGLQPALNYAKKYCDGEIFFPFFKNVSITLRTYTILSLVLNSECGELL